MSLIFSLISDFPLNSSQVQRRAAGPVQVIWLFDDYLILAQCQLYIDSLHFKYVHLKAA